MRPQQRAVSTVVDVSLALLLVTASVATMIIFLEDDQTPSETRDADELSETLSVTTFGVQYSVENLEAKDEFEGDEHYDYRRTTHGTSLELLADATTSSVTFDVPSGDGQVNHASRPYVSAIEAGVNERITGADETAHVVAIWRPYNRSEIEGKVTVGPKPPDDARVSTTTVRLPSRFDAIPEPRIEDAYARGGKRAVAELLAETIVEGYFPQTGSQLALERRGLEGEITRYRYLRFRNIVRSYDETSGFEYTGRPMFKVYNRESADAEQANEDLTEALTEIILAELEAKYPNDVSGATLADAVSTGQVVIVIQTWN